MKTTPRAGDYVRTAGMTIPQYHAVAKVFIRAGASPGEYPSDYQFNIHEAFGINKNTKSLFHAAAKSGDEEYKLNGRELSLSDLLGDRQSMAEFLGAVPTIESILKDSDSTWSGEGLPPVGAECEVLNRELGSSAAWEKCKILFMGQYNCVYSSESCRERIGRIDLVGMVEFRPLKSEREIAIEEISQLINNCAGISNIAAAIYDSGNWKS